MFTKYITAIQAGFKAATVDFKCAVTDAKVDVALDQDVCVAPTLSRTYKVTYTVAKYVLKAWNWVCNKHTVVCDLVAKHPVLAPVVALTTIVTSVIALVLTAVLFNSTALLVVAMVAELALTAYSSFVIANSYAVAVAKKFNVEGFIAQFVLGFAMYTVVFVAMCVAKLAIAAVLF